MKPKPECVLCTVKWVFERLTAGLEADDKTNFQLLRKILGILGDKFTQDTSPAKAANIVLEHIKEAIELSRPYFEVIKAQSNEIAKQLLPQLEEALEKTKDEVERLERKLLVATLSNVAPIGKPDKSFDFYDVKTYLQGSPVPLTASADLKTKISKAKSILYILDNAGEVGFDSLVIEELKNNNKKIYLVCKKDYFFDDATLNDIEYFAIDKLVDDIIISNGIFLPEEADPPSKDLLKNVDLIISKGTGNYEALKDDFTHKDIIFALKIKCERVGNYYKMPVGSYVIDRCNAI